MALVVPSARSRSLSWSSVDRVFHIATRRGEAVGYVDTTSAGRFVAFGSDASPLGYFSTLVAARAAVAHATPRGTGRPRLTDRTGLVAATGLGILALLSLATAVVVAPLL